MQPKISIIRIQNTPIKTIALSWWENDTLNYIDFPVSWAMRTFLAAPVYESTINNPAIVAELVNDIRVYFTHWLASIRLSFPERISVMQCAVETIPEQFKTTIAV